MGKHISVLIVDDNDRFRESLRVVVSTIENVAAIHEAKNGDEAISFALEQAPDIILMDINMSPVNGFEATRKILGKNPGIKIIGLSLHNEVSYCRNLIRLGAKGFITKSSSYNEIVIAIREVIAGRKYIDKNISNK